MLYWNPNLFLIGIKTIDDQHQEMFKVINDLHDGLNTDQQVDKIAATFQFLEDYVVRHFQLETALMEKYNYPGKTNHLREHDHFTHDLQSLLQDFASKRANKQVALSLFGKLSNWLVEHISSTDVEMGEFLKEHMVQ